MLYLLTDKLIPVTENIQCIELYLVAGILGLRWIAKKKYWYYDDVIKWKHFPRHWPFVLGIHRSPVNSPQRQVTRSLMFSLICAWINGWVNNREAGDLTRYSAHYDITVMLLLSVATCLKSQEGVSYSLLYITKLEITLAHQKPFSLIFFSIKVDL